MAIIMIFIGCSGDNSGDPTGPGITGNPLDQFQCQNYNSLQTVSTQADVPASSYSNIINGTATSISQWPWIGAVVYQGESFPLGFHCGGTLIHPNWVLTAAHCLDKYGVDVILGTSNLVNMSGSAERIAVAEKIRHPQYDPETAEHDVALYRLSTPSQQTPARIDRASLAGDGKMSQVAGWGATDPTGRHPSPELLQITIPIVSDTVCDQTMGELLPITHGMFCAGDQAGGKDSCAGDSGGPLMVNGVLTGIVSWGADRCADPETYGVYTRVSDYADWISSEICSRESGS